MGEGGSVVRCMVPGPGALVGTLHPSSGQTRLGGALGTQRHAADHVASRPTRPTDPRDTDPTA